MSSVSLTGSDVVQINDRILADFGDGDIASLTFATDISSVKSAKNGNKLYAFNESGRECELTVRVLVGSADDAYLNSLLTTQKTDFSSFLLITGVFTKKAGDGKGGLVSVTYQCTGGIFKKQVDQRTNAEGAPEQSVAVYVIKFGNGDRVVA